MKFLRRIPASALVVLVIGATVGLIAFMQHSYNRSNEYFERRVAEQRQLNVPGVVTLGRSICADLTIGKVHVATVQARVVQYSHLSSKDASGLVHDAVDTFCPSEAQRVAAGR